MAFRRRGARRSTRRMRRPRTSFKRRPFRKRTRGFRRGKGGYRRGGVVLLKTTVVHYLNADPAVVPPVGNIDISDSISAVTPLPHNGAGYFSFAAIPDCQWDAYSLLYEQVQFRGVKIVYHAGPALPDASGAPLPGPLVHAYDADSAELESYATLLTRPNSRRLLGAGAMTGGPTSQGRPSNSREASMYLVPRTGMNVQSAVGAVVSRKRLWYDLQNLNIQDIPFFGYKWYVAPSTGIFSILITYYLAFRGPRGCQSVGQALAKLKADANVVSAELVSEDEDCGCGA